MGKGRKKTREFPSKEKYEAPWTVNMSGTARNLTKDKLGGVIFGCKNHTITECLENELFGLPAPHHSYVKKIQPGLTLYLFNYSDRMLHGIFEAVSTGQMNLSPNAWAASEGVERTPYPSQVRVREQRKCCPLVEDEFKPIIKNNYYKERLFKFELDHEQNRRMRELFLSSPLPEKMLRLPSAALKNKAFDVSSSSNVNKNVVEKFKCQNSEEYPGIAKARSRENEDSFTTVDDKDSFALDKKWSDLLKPSPSSCGVQNEEGLEYQTVGLKSSMTEWEFASSSDGWSQPPPEACLNDSDSCYAGYWEDNPSDNSVREIYENKVTYSQYCDPENDRPDPIETSSVSIKVSDEEGELMCSQLDYPQPEGKCLIDTKEKVRSGTDLTSIENCERNHDQFNLTDKAFHEDSNAVSAAVLKEVQSSDYQCVIAKLMQEVGVLKASQVKQRLRLESLEHELVHSKVEIDHLRSKYHKLDSMLSSTNCDSEDCASPTVKPEESVFILGGFDGRSWLSDLSLYSPSSDRVESLCPMTTTRPYASSAKLNGDLYIFGGALGGVWYDTVESYNPINNRWVQQPCLNRRKGCMAGASMYETIFAIGGSSNGDEYFSEVELFDLHIGSWVSTQPMLEKRSSPAAADLNGALYVSGGYDGRGCLRSVERLDLRTHSWTKLGCMNMKRWCHSLVAFNEKLYALGGCEEDTVGSSVEVYEPRIGSWMMVEPMNVSRKAFGSFVLEGKIYIVGGMQDNQVLDLVECYSEHCGWQMTGATSLGKRSFLSALVL